MKEDIIKAIVYTELDEILGPKPVLCYPPNLSQDVQTRVSIKAITLLATEQGKLPSSLILIPFPSLDLKGIIKYIETKKKNNRGGVVQFAITVVFNEMDDIIFYKYIGNLETAFDKSANNIIELEESEGSKKSVANAIKNLHDNLLSILEEMRMLEYSSSMSESFPEKKIEKITYRFKIIVLGDPEVGKTSLVLRYTKNAFRRSYLPTIGVNVSEKTMKVNNVVVQFVVWDIAGQTKFQITRRPFYKGAQGVLLVFDQTNLESFYNLSNWYQDIMREREDDDDSQLYGLILGNKSDLVSERKVSKENAIKFAQELNFGYIETSALTGDNVEQTFKTMAEALSKG